MLWLYIHAINCEPGCNTYGLWFFIFLEPPPHSDIPVDRGLLDFLGEERGVCHDSTCKNGIPGCISFSFMNFYFQKVTPPSDNPDGWRGDYTLERKGGIAWIHMHEKWNPSCIIFCFIDFYSQRETPLVMPLMGVTPLKLGVGIFFWKGSWVQHDSSCKKWQTLQY